MSPVTFVCFSREIKYDILVVVSVRGRPPQAVTNQVLGGDSLRMPKSIQMHWNGIFCVPRKSIRMKLLVDLAS